MKNLLLTIKKLVFQTDPVLFSLSFVTALIGLVFIYSATLSYSNTLRYVMVQSAGIIIGIIGMIIISRFDTDNLAQFARLFFAVGIALLVLVLFVGIGLKETGNASWIRFGVIGIQPSEIVKIIFIITFSTHICHVLDHISSPKTLLGLAAHSILITGLVQMQGDLGSALVFLFITACLLFAAGLNLLYFGGVAVLLLISLPFIWTGVLKEYQRQRILVVMYPELDPTGFGYQATQCKTAIGSGQLWGRGLFKGTLTQYELLPAKHTDCIFAVIGEEGGFILCLLVIILLVAIILRCLYIATISRNKTGFFICIGIGAMILFQSYENIGMCLGALPVIGITLPFLSYGGSSVVSLFWSLGLVMSVYRTKKFTQFY